MKSIVKTKLHKNIINHYKEYHSCLRTKLKMKNQIKLKSIMMNKK